MFHLLNSLIQFVWYLLNLCLAQSQIFHDLYPFDCNFLEDFRLEIDQDFVNLLSFENDTGYLLFLIGLFNKDKIGTRS